MPKYNIGDKVWKVVNQKCVEVEVSAIESRIDYLSQVTFEYSTEKPRETPSYHGISSKELKHKYQPEDFLFPSKEALVEYLSS